MTVKRTDFFTERPAVGTRVILKAGTLGAWCPPNTDLHGVVTGHHSDKSYVRARFDDSRRNFQDDWGAWNALLPEEPTPAEPSPSEITLNGVRYTLTPVQEAEAAPEPKREPQMGEIWRWDDDKLLLITDENKAVHLTRLYGVQFVDAKRLTGWHNAAFAYPDLRAAIAAGVLS